MLTKNILFKNFKRAKVSKKISLNLKKLLFKKNQILFSLSNEYKDKYNIKKIKKLKRNINTRVIGMGGSILGSKAIYSFLRTLTSKNFSFFDNLDSNFKPDKKKYLNLVISKSGNTLETISNFNILFKKKDENCFLTENKKNELFLLAEKLKSDVIHHNNFIGGRYSVLSEVGMLPAELMGFNPNKFRQLNNLIKNKKFINSLIANVNSIISLSKNKSNSIILNYDPKSEDFLEWYKQLAAESLGKKNKGFLPVISNMPKDNHSVMQFYLDGPKKNFFTFFSLTGNSSPKIKSDFLSTNNRFLKNKSINQIKMYQKIATENVFKKRNIPFRSFEIKKRDEKTLGELFIFFILETILLANALGVNPYDQPAVELIKKETKKQIS